jgi:hypothetical protein
MTPPPSGRLSGASARIVSRPDPGGAVMTRTQGRSFAKTAALVATGMTLLGALPGCASPRPAPADTATRELAAVSAFANVSSRTEPVIRHVIGGRIHYLAPAPCCDRLDPLFDAEGRYVCAPSGGFAGGGDRRCPRPILDGLRAGKGEQVANPFLRR